MTKNKNFKYSLSLNEIKFIESKNCGDVFCKCKCCFNTLKLEMYETTLFKFIDKENTHLELKIDDLSLGKENYLYNSEELIFYAYKNIPKHLKKEFHKDIYLEKLLNNKKFVKYLLTEAGYDLNKLDNINAKIGSFEHIKNHILLMDILKNELKKG